MKEMTDDQLKQVIALLLTTVDHREVSRYRAQDAMKDPEFPARFEEFLHTYKVQENRKVRVREIRVRVNLALLWKTAINTIPFRTPDDAPVRKVGDHYLPASRGREAGEEVTLVLVNYPNADGGWKKARAWAKREDYKNSNPRDIFAIGEQHPLLHEHLGENMRFVVETRGLGVCQCDESACAVYWINGPLEACIHQVTQYNGKDVWFVFRK